MFMCVACTPSGCSKGTQTYYRHHIRQHFNGHREEDDQQRVASMIARARQDAEWVLRKVRQRWLGGGACVLAALSWGCMQR